MHVDVPWVLVDGVLLENTNLLQKAVCDAYTGTKPSSCKRAAKYSSAKEVPHSKNDSN